MPPTRTAFFTPPGLALGALLLPMVPGCVIDELREDEVGDAPACDAARRWPETYAAREDILLEEITELRRRGGECGKSTFNPLPDIVLNPELHCAARVHATHLADRAALSHEGLDGSSPLARVTAAGYDGVPIHELVAGDYQDPFAVLEAWREDPDTCRVFHDPRIDEIGIGHAESPSGDAAAWVLLTGERRE